MRGAIYNVERYKQLLDFSGLRFERNITPTDIDMFLDFGGKEFIVGEFKKTGNSMPYGQELALNQLLKNLSRNPRNEVLGFVAEHNTPVDQQINAASCYVAKVWRIREPKWLQPSRPITVKDLIDRWRDFCLDAEPVLIDRIEFSKDLKGAYIASKLFKNLSEDQIAEITFCFLERHRQKLSISDDLLQLPIFSQFVA